MDFNEVKINKGAEPPARKGGGGREPIDFTPLFEAARAADGEWCDVPGGSALNNYRTAILQGAPDGCEVGEFDVRVVEEVAPDTSVEPAVVGEYRLYICQADDENKARIIANNERRLERAAEKAKADKAGKKGGKSEAPASDEAPQVDDTSDEDDPLA